MTLAELAAALEKAIDPHGELRIDATTFPDLVPLLTATHVPELTISGAAVAMPAAVTIDGQAAVFGSRLGGIHIEVSDGVPYAEVLRFTAPAGWGFIDGFAGLPPSYTHVTANPGLIGLDASALYGLQLDAAVLTATAGADALDFEGTLSSSAQFSFLAGPLSLPAKPPLSGTIRFPATGPARPDLVVGGGDAKLEIGSALTFEHAGIRAHTVAEDPATGAALSRVDLMATLMVGHTDPVPVKLSSPFHELSGMLELSADFGQAGLTIGRGVAAFAELLGLDAGQFALPKPLDVLSSFGLQTITCVVEPGAATVHRLVITVGPNVPWTIATGVEVDGLTVGWAIAFPFNASARDMSASIAGTLALGTVDPKLEFDVWAGTQGGFAAAGELAHPMTLEQIVTTVNGSPVPGLPTLDVIEAAISASADGSFSLVVRLANWKIGDIAGTAIELYEVTASLARDTGGASGAFLVVLGVGSARLYLSAQIAMGSAGNTGWTFAGGTQPGTSLAIGDLLEELATTFGIEAVPAPIATMSLTGLNLRYVTATGEFTFTCEADLTIADTPVAVIVTIRLAPVHTSAQAEPPAPAGAATVTGTKGYSATFTGTVRFGTYEFDMVFDAEPSVDVFVAAYRHTGASASTELRAFVQTVSPAVAAEIPAGITVGLDQVKFVFLKQTASSWAFGLRLGASIDLSKLPIVGSKLPAAETLAVEQLAILYSSADLTPTQTAILNPLLPSGIDKLPDTVGHGIAFDADVALGTTTKHLHAGVTPPATPTQQLAAPPGAAPAPPGGPSLPAPPPATPASSTDPVHWLDINKQFGVFSFQRVGVGYQNNVLDLALDASVALGPVAMSMQALSVSSPLTRFDPSFSLSGLALTLDRPPITLGGAFLKVPEIVDGHSITSYYGEVIVGASRFSLRALGGWSPDAQPAMFFIYLNVNAPIGGPPYLFVTGLAGGFGINSSLTLPTIDEVGSFPLLPAHAPAEQGSPAATIAAVIPALQHTFHPQAGQYWVAAGIQFTSFEMIQAQAVVSVAFGVELQIGVVGTCSMTFPLATGGGAALAYVEIDVVASLTPSTGLLAVDGKLSPASNLFGGFVKLTGGFAMYVWFSGDHAGDFVITLGGYHPAFDKPKEYPVVPRLGLSFALGPIKVSGEAYFALTPGAFMAGMRISATFEGGPVRAWFDAGVDFIIAWAPLHYEATAWITIGCSVDLGLFTLSVQVSASLEIWGPDLGGTATVDLDVVSFTIAFGAERRPPLPIGWSTFSTSFLPAPTGAATQAMAPHAAAARTLRAAAAATTNVITATLTAGRAGTGPPGVAWVVDPDGFRILVTSTLPANHLHWATATAQADELPNVVADYVRLPAAGTEPAGALAAAPTTVPDEMELALEHGTKTYSPTEVWEPVLNLAPMAVTGVASHMTVALRRFDDATGDYTDYVASVTLAPQLAPSSAALWGAAPDPSDPNTGRLIEATLTGVSLTPVPRQPDQVSHVSLLSLIYGEGHRTGFGYQSPAVDGRYTVASSITHDGETLTITVTGPGAPTLPDQTGFTLSALTDGWVTGQRTATLGELRTLGFTTAAPDATALTTMAATALTDWPAVALIGAQP